MTEAAADRILLGLGWYIIFVFSATLHEASHAYAARKGGDPTAYLGGQVTLDPVPHIRREPFGMILMPLISFFMWGWMIGWASTPYNPFWAARYPKRAAIMSMAGPAANLFLVLCAAFFIRLGMQIGIFTAPQAANVTHVTAAASGGAAAAAAVVVSILFTLNLVLFLFNIMPIPPLDGSGMLSLFIGSENAAKMREAMRRPFVMIIGLLIVWRVFGYIFDPIFTLALNILYPGMGYR
jgi:Zn-dependent protease